MAYPELLQNKKPLKCLVLGASGFIGSHLVKALIKEGHFVKLFNRVPDLTFDDSLSSVTEIIQGDFNNETLLANALAECDICFHLISTVLPKTSNIDPAYDVRTNLIGTIKLLDYAAQLGLKKIIFLSSGGTVYGYPKQLPIPEDHPTDPICSYGITKLAIEKYLEFYYQHHGLNYVVLRLSNPYGARNRTNNNQGIIPIFLEKIIRQECVEIWGDGTVVRDYIYISDVIDALIKAINYQGSARIFNIGSGQGRSINHILEDIEHILECKVKKQYTASRVFDVPANILDISRAEQVLNWAPQVTFAEGLVATMNWLNNKLAV